MTQPTASFAQFAPRTPLTNPLRAHITAAYRRPEPEALAPLLAQARLPQELATASQQLALRIAKPALAGLAWCRACCKSFRCHPKKAWR